MSNNRFSMVGYTGAVIDHGFWKKFVIDIDGIHTPQGKMPALREHDRLRPAGVIDDVKKGRTFNAGGYFLKNADGHQLSKLIAEGFPFQSSIGVWFEEIEQIEEDETALVNGGLFEGPGVIARKSFVREVSFVTLGADSQTSVKNLKSGVINEMQNLTDQPKGFDDALVFFMNEGNTVDKSIELAAEAYPDLYQAYVDEIRDPLKYENQ